MLLIREFDIGLREQSQYQKRQKIKGWSIKNEIQIPNSQLLLGEPSKQFFCRRQFIMNTKELGKLRLFVYKTGAEYIGVCLELNLIVREKTQRDAVKHLLKMTQGYLETVLAENLDNKLLNEKVSLKYYLIYYSGLLVYAITHIKNSFFNVELPVIDGKIGVELPA